ncbi:excisionase family DNA-binding protein [Mycobacterium gordonae]|uniref:excisionase family DNA-binding protein n=1 Tax=Mycobacterium gordonae TaxID=1778 RepID=UPI00210AC412|nr:excisionase family DNA-binding protein [Mycobacterium gordonae]MCQ4360642.1 excisionase family DNA-binding protein [Mycobacterium gordonae]
MAKLQSRPQPNPPTDGNRATRRARKYGKISEAAEYLGVTDRTIRQMIADGRLTGYRSGSRLVRVDLNEIDSAMKPFGGAA